MKKSSLIVIEQLLPDFQFPGNSTFITFPLSFSLQLAFLCRDHLFLLICLKYAYNFSFKHFHDGCYKILVNKSIISVTYMGSKD